MLKPVWLPSAVPSASLSEAVPVDAGFSGYGGRAYSPEVRDVALISAIVLAALIAFLVILVVSASTRRASRFATLTRRLPGSMIASVGFLSQLYDTPTIANVRARKITNLSADAQAITLWGGGRTPVAIILIPWCDVQSVESGTFETVSRRPLAADDRRYTAALYVGALLDETPVSLPFAVYRDKRANHAPIVLDGYALREVVDRIDGLRHASRSTAARLDHREAPGA